MIGMDDSDRNYDIVHMIKKIALAIEKKNTQDLRNIAEELEAWEPRDNWDEMDVRTKVFVEHVLVGLARIRLGLDVLDKGASELTEIRQEVEEKEMNDAVADSLDEYDYADTKTGFVCFKCGERKIGRSALEDSVGNKMCSRCARALGGKKVEDIQNLMGEDKSDFKKKMDKLQREYDKLQRECDGLAQGITTENIDEFCKRNLDSVDEEKKFTCEKCGERKRRSAPGASNCKEVDGHTICGRCYRDFRNWFVKTDKKLDDFWVGNDKLSRDEREKRLGDLHKKISWMKKNFGFRDKKGIDWERYHKKRRGRFKKDELSDDEKEDLK